jgi:dTDP-4-dehydrorhamnose 3,5-epimerase
VIFTETELPGAFVIDIEPREDERGFFARAWCEREFAEHGLSTRIAQCSLAYNDRKSTLRGMHFQAAPRAEVKIVRCTRGAIYDVVVDLRPRSPTFKRWAAVELSAENRRMLYVPEGIAHGYQTLEDGTETYYLISEPYAPGFEGGVRWDDPAFGILWPEATVRIISDKDRSWPDYRSEHFVST